MSARRLFPRRRRPMRGVATNRRGAALVEIMVAMSVMVIALTGVAGMTVQASRRSATLAGSAGRTAVQTRVVDQLMVQPFTTLASKAGCTTVTTAPYPHRRCVTVADLSSDRRQVTVIFTPSNRYMRPDTLIFERSRSMAGSPLH